MALQLVAPNDPRLSWHGHISLQRTADWVMPWRIPYREQALFPPDAFAASDQQSRAAMPAGVRLAFRSDTTIVAGRIVAQPEASPLDLSCDGQVYGSVALTGQERFRFADLPPGEKLIELWLPQHGEFRLRSLELSAGASVAPYDRSSAALGDLRELHYALPDGRAAYRDVARACRQSQRPEPDLPGVRRQLPPGADGGPHDPGPARRPPFHEGRHQCP